MKKIVIIMLAIVMAFALITVAACQEEVVTVRVNLYVTENEEPITRNHVIGQDDLPIVMNGDMVFGGWYYDKECNNNPYSYTDTEITSGTSLYAKWNLPDGKVVVTLNPNYEGASNDVRTIDKNSTLSLPEITREGYIFDGWFTEPTGGRLWTNSTPFTESTTLYASWSDEPKVTDLSGVFSKYADDSTRNFSQKLTFGDGSSETYDYMGNIIANTYEANDGNTYTDYIEMSDESFFYYYDNGDGTYSKYDENSEEILELVSEWYIIDLTELSGFTFIGVNGVYQAQKPNDVGNAVIGEFDSAWTSFTLYIADDKITKIEAAIGTESLTITFSKYGEVNITLPEVKFNVTLNSNYTGAASQQLEVLYGQTFDLSKYTPTREGYTFDGWFTDSVGGGVWTSDMPVYADITLYAHWTDSSAVVTPVDLSAVLSQYSNKSAWNFAVDFTISLGSEQQSDYYEYLGAKLAHAYSEDGVDYVDYLSNGNFYYDNGDGTYDTYSEDDIYYQFFVMYLYTIDLSTIGDYQFDAVGSAYVAKTPVELGNNIIGAYEGSVWTSITLYVENGRISQLVCLSDDGYAMTFNFSKYGAIDFKLPDEGGETTEKVTLTLNPNYDGATALEYEIDKNSTFNLPTLKREGYVLDGWYTAATGGTKWTSSTPVTADTTLYAHWTDASTPAPEPSDIMEDQVYDADSFDDSNLQDRLLNDKDKEGNFIDGSIGLPSEGTYNALVIPVQFKGDTITQSQINKLNLAFNGTSADTGWESVRTFYQKSSYGKLNLTFDIQSVYQAQNTASYYESLTETYQGETYSIGDSVILKEVLSYYESILDLTKYDTNKDGCIDAVYLIYSAPVDYKSDDSFYWAFVNFYDGEEEYDGLYAYYYLFAGFDFMDEKLDEYNGLKINAETYIHETGHLLGLDDYYDYYQRTGSDNGLGGADMMDNNVGDHGAYSKIMLGWITPEIITSSQTVTISSLQSQQGDRKVILVPLKFNNSYFCEYLLIDLYSKQGLNALPASAEETVLYDGAEYGVRIYHVSSSADNPYSDSYASFTDNNNSVSDVALIKLIEADGQTSTSSNAQGAWASASDLWQAGDNLNEVFPDYARNDGKALNFNVTIDSVSADSATVTITFINSAAA